MPASDGCCAPSAAVAAVRVAFERDQRKMGWAGALFVAALILFVLAHAFPFMTFKLEGREQLSTLLSGVVGLFQLHLTRVANGPGPAGRARHAAPERSTLFLSSDSATARSLSTKTETGASLSCMSPVRSNQFSSLVARPS